MENCCKQQNLGFIKSCIINKSGHTAKGLNLNERESSESGEHFIEYVYWTCIRGSSIPNEINKTMSLWLRHLLKIKKGHTQCVSLEYMNMNSIRN